MTEPTKIQYKIEAGEKLATKEELDTIAIRATKGIPMRSDDGRTWIVFVDNTGSLIVQEVV